MCVIVRKISWHIKDRFNFLCIVSLCAFLNKIETNQYCWNINYYFFKSTSVLYNHQFQEHRYSIFNSIGMFIRLLHACLLWCSRLCERCGLETLQGADFACSKFFSHSNSSKELSRPDYFVPLIWCSTLALSRSLLSSQGYELTKYKYSHYCN